jgi:hypothetical protein
MCLVWPAIPRGAQAGEHGSFLQESRLVSAGVGFETNHSAGALQLTSQLPPSPRPRGVIACNSTFLPQYCLTATDCPIVARHRRLIWC